MKTPSVDTKRQAERAEFQARVAKLAESYDELSSQFERLFGQPLPPPPSPAAVRAMRRRKRPKLTPKQSRLIRNITKGMNITDAALAAGYSDSSRMTAGQCGSQALEAIRRRMPEILEQHGLTDDVLIEKYLKPLLNATETKFFQKDGKVVSTRTVKALGTRTAALDMAFNLGGKYPQRDRDVSVGSVNIVDAGCRPDWLPKQMDGESIVIEADKLPSPQPKDDGGEQKDANTDARSSDALAAPGATKSNGRLRSSSFQGSLE